MCRSIQPVYISVSEPGQFHRQTLHKTDAFYHQSYASFSKTELTIPERLTNFMEHSPSSEAISRSASQIDPRFYGILSFVTVTTRAHH
jgi:hypothetical protein